MIKTYAMQAGERAVIELPEDVFESVDFSPKDKWFHLQDPTDKDIETIISLTGAPEEFLKAPLDEEERARVDAEDGFTLVLVDIPVTEDEEVYYTYSTIPLGVLVGNDTVITVCLQNTSIINDFIMGRVKGVSIKKRSWFVLKILYSVATKFLQYLRQIDKASQRIQNELTKTIKDTQLVQLLELQNALVYFSTSLQANEAVINKITRTEVLKKYEEDSELLEDVHIENQQAIEMCTIYRNILSATMEGFSSISSNKMNKTMQFLTAITFIISLPTLIASIFGMNVKVPWQNEMVGFWITLGMCLISSLVSAFFLFRKPKQAKVQKIKKEKQRKRN